MIWCLKKKNIDMTNLLDFQVINHFDKNFALTSKFGLASSLKNLIWHENIDIDKFYPRCFDLFDSIEFEDFIEEFKLSKAESILKDYDSNNENSKEISEI